MSFLFLYANQADERGRPISGGCVRQLCVYSIDVSLYLNQDAPRRRLGYRAAADYCSDHHGLCVYLLRFGSLLSFLHTLH